MIRIVVAVGLAVTISRAPLAQSQAARDSAEASVLRWLSRRFTDSTVIIHTTSGGRICDTRAATPGTVGARLREFGVIGCGPENGATQAEKAFGITPAVRAAIASHDSLNDISAEFPARVLQLTGLRVLDSLSQADNGSCRGLLRLRASRVGFDSTLSYAAVSYDFSQGHGPYPGCGSSGGATVYLRRRADDTWEVIETAVYRIS